MQCDYATYDINTTFSVMDGCCKNQISIKFFLMVFEYGHPLICLKFWQY